MEEQQATSSAVELVFGALKRMREELDNDVFTPDERPRSQEQYSAMLRMARELQDDIFGNMDAAYRRNPEGTNAQLRPAATDFAAQLTALLYLSGYELEAGQLASAAARIASDIGRPEFEAASGSRQAFCELQRARALLRSGEGKECDSVLRKIAKDREVASAIRNAAQKLRDRPQPVTSAPGMATLNGIGTKLYGRRDIVGGTCIATLYFVVLFIPIIPIASYRVAIHDNGRYSFYTKERLGLLARWYSRLLALAIVGAVAIGSFNLYFNSPSRLVRIELAEAAALESAGDITGALEAYEGTIRMFGAANQMAVRPAVHAYLRLIAERAPDRIAAGDVGVADSLYRQYVSLPLAVQRAENTEVVHAYLLDWCDEIGLESEEAASAIVRLTGIGANLPSSATDELRARRLEATAVLANLIVDEWPADALTQFAALMPAQEMCPDALVALSRIEDSPSLLLEYVDVVTPVLTHCADEATIDLIQAQFSRGNGWLANPERDVALASGGAALLEFTRQHPEDVELHVATAQSMRIAGDSAQALLTLERLGPVGMRGSQATVLSAELLSEVGRVPEALQILRHYTQMHLGAYQSAAVLYDQRAIQFIDSLYTAAENGTLPIADVDRLNSLPESEIAAAFDTYVQQRIAGSRELENLRISVESHGDAVLASMMRGSLALELASTSSGPERDALLAEAESSYIAIQAEGQGVAAYHIGLAVVYHRLNRPSDADAEVQHIQDSGSAIDLADLASAYRELGFADRARQTAAVANARATDDETRAYIAGLRYLLAANEEEANQILAEGPANDPNLQRYRDEQTAATLFDNGDLEAAIEIYWRLADDQAAEATHDSTAANNAALAYMRVFEVTGEQRAMERAEELMAQASRLEPNSAIVAMNYYELAISLALTDLFDQRIDLTALNLSSSQLSTLATVATQNNDELLDELSASPLITITLQQARRARTLAPQNAAVYQNGVEVAHWMNDAETIERIERAALAVEFDHSLMTQSWNDYTSGSLDEVLREANTTAVDEAATLLRSARLTRDTDTIDAARILLAFELLESVTLDLNHDDMERALQELGAVSGDLFDVRSRLATAQIGLAMLEVHAANPSLLPEFEMHVRTYGLGTLLAHRIHLAGGPAAEALHSHALVVGMAGSGDRFPDPSFSGFVAAELCNDQAGMTLHSGFSEDRLDAAEVRLAAIVAPFPRQLYEAELYATRAP